MSRKDYCKFVDVFFGNGATDHFPTDGVSSKWFYIKAICGNTSPHAVLPFGRISVGAYNGGVAVHRYTFPTNAGRVAVDFSNDGLSKHSPIASTPLPKTPL